MSAQIKLTLRLDEQLIQRAKSNAKKAGKSLSRVVADYFTLLAESTSVPVTNLPPLTRSLKGAFQAREEKKQVSEEDYHRYLLDKYR